MTTRIILGDALIVDHFIVTEQFFKEFIIVKVDVLHEIDNTSDDDRICFNLSLDVSHLSLCNRTFVPKVDWYKAKPKDVDAQSTLLQQKVAEFHFPVDSVLCRGVFCCSISYLHQ